MTDEEETITWCPECSAMVSWEVPCPNGCEPLWNYLCDLPFPISLQEGDEDSLLLVTLSDVLEMVRRLEASSDGTTYIKSTVIRYGDSRGDSY